MKIQIKRLGSCQAAAQNESGYAFQDGFQQKALSNLLGLFYSDMDDLALAAMTAGIPESNFILMGPMLTHDNGVATISGRLGFIPVNM